MNFSKHDQAYFNSESKYKIHTEDFDVSNFVHITNDCTIAILSALDLLAITDDENIHI